MIKWDTKYKEIVQEFKYDKRLDYEASIILNSILKKTIPNSTVSSIINNKIIFVVGAGTSLNRAIPILKKFKNVIISADSATKPLVESGITPDIITTDLDGYTNPLKSIFVVHAHGDNITKLHKATNFENCIGTTQSKPYKKIQNFGGFTDGDRAVFLASHFKAKKIILFGMDYNGKIGRFSNTKKVDYPLKLKKLVKSRDLLTWLSKNTKSELFTISTPIEGFKKINQRDLECIL